VIDSRLPERSFDFRFTEDQWQRLKQLNERNRGPGLPFDAAPFKETLERMVASLHWVQAGCPFTMHPERFVRMESKRGVPPSNKRGPKGDREFTTMVVVFFFIQGLPIMRSQKDPWLEDLLKELCNIAGARLPAIDDVIREVAKWNLEEYWMLCEKIAGRQERDV
jgi:hypothetical protein